MTRTDSIVVGTLVVLLALVAGLVGVPALDTTAGRATQSPFEPIAARPYREGVLGRPVSISPLTAASPAVNTVYGTLGIDASRVPQPTTSA